MYSDMRGEAQRNAFFEKAGVGVALVPTFVRVRIGAVVIGPDLLIPHVTLDLIDQLHPWRRIVLKRLFRLWRVRKKYSVSLGWQLPMRF